MSFEEFKLWDTKEVIMKKITMAFKNFNAKKEIIMLITLILLTLVFSICKINNMIFPFISISLNIFLIIIYKQVKRMLNIDFSKMEKIIIIASIILIYMFYIISIYNRKFIYYWDFSCYYNLQTLTGVSFSNGLIEGIKSFLGSTWSGEY